MIRVFFFYFWPVLIPIVLYTLWFLWSNYRLEEGKDPLKWTDGPWGVIFIGMLIIALLCFIPVIYFHVTPKGDSYKPAEFKDGKLIPGTIK